jgi:hypothetical protein
MFELSLVFRYSILPIKSKEMYLPTLPQMLLSSFGSEREIELQVPQTD